MEKLWLLRARGTSDQLATPQVFFRYLSQTMSYLHAYILLESSTCHPKLSDKLMFPLLVGKYMFRVDINNNCYTTLESEIALTATAFRKVPLST
jgi:hypothetical protein